MSLALFAKLSDLEKRVAELEADLAALIKLLSDTTPPAKPKQKVA